MTKAKSRSAKLRAKRERGRPMLEAEEREPNGRPSRRKASVEARQTETEREIKSVAREARVRVLGIPEASSERREAGYVLGRLYLAGWIEKHHLEAGDQMAMDFARYYGLTGIPFPSARAQDMFRVRGMPIDSDPKAARSAANRVMSIEQALAAVDVSGRPVTTAVKRVCLLDGDEGIYLRHMLRHLARGLEALVDFYGIEREKKKMTA